MRTIKCFQQNNTSIRIRWIFVNLKGKGKIIIFVSIFFLYNLHVVWNNPKRPKNIIGISCIHIYKKFNALVLSDEMTRKQMELYGQENKCFKKQQRLQKPLIFWRLFIKIQQTCLDNHFGSGFENIFRHS